MCGEQLCILTYIRPAMPCVPARPPTAAPPLSRHTPTHRTHPCPPLKVERVQSDQCAQWTMDNDQWTIPQTSLHIHTPQLSCLHACLQLSLVSTRLASQTRRRRARPCAAPRPGACSTTTPHLTPGRITSGCGRQTTIAHGRPESRPSPRSVPRCGTRVAPLDLTQHQLTVTGVLLDLT